MCFLFNTFKAIKLLFFYFTRNGKLYKADPDPDPELEKKWTPDLQKKRTLYQNLLYEIKTYS